EPPSNRRVPDWVSGGSVIAPLAESLLGARPARSNALKTAHSDQRPFAGQAALLGGAGVDVAAGAVRSVGVALASPLSLPATCCPSRPQARMLVSPIARPSSERIDVPTS